MSRSSIYFRKSFIFLFPGRTFLLSEKTQRHQPLLLLPASDILSLPTDHRNCPSVQNVSLFSFCFLITSLFVFLFVIVSVFVFVFFVWIILFSDKIGRLCMYYIYFLRVAKSKIYHIDIIFFGFSCFLWLFLSEASQGARRNQAVSRVVTKYFVLKI